MHYMFINLLLLLSVISCSRGEKYGPSSSPPICKVTGCVCTENTTTISCDFSLQQDVCIDASSLPRGLRQLQIVGGRNLTFAEISFSKLRFLEYLSVTNASSLTLKKSSFLNSSQPQLRFVIANVDRVLIESGAFYLVKGPVAVQIRKCDRLTVHSDAIRSIQELEISDVSTLELSENAFSQAYVNNLDRKPKLKITLARVTATELPKNSFPSAEEVTLFDCDIKIVRTNAFSAVSLVNVSLENSSFRVLESEAFSSKSLIKALRLKNVTIGQLCTGAITSPVENFSISNSTIKMIEEEGFDMLTMFDVSFTNNDFLHVREKGITLKEWRTAIVENNTLRKLDSEAIYVPYDERYAEKRVRFRFVGNILEDLESASLNLNVGPEKSIDVSANIFIRKCECDLRSSVEGYVRTDDRDVMNWLYDGAYCNVDRRRAGCFNDQFVKISNFTAYVCRPGHTIACPESNETVPQKDSNFEKAVDILQGRMADRQQTVIRAVIAVAMAGGLVTFALVVCLWLNGKEGRLRAKCPAPSSLGHLLAAAFRRLSAPGKIVRSTSSNSIARVSVHEYAEVRPHKLPDDDDDDDDDTYVCEDKATQTLPEELTQELLQALREKLDDPENCREAHNMIEHLYDLIKVEQCCNENVLDDEPSVACPDPADEYGTVATAENVYDEIQPRTTRKVRKHDRKQTANKGTRAPSPDKLTPQSFTTSTFSGTLLARRTSEAAAPPPLTEYAEPLDRHSGVYSEPLYDRICQQNGSYPNSGGGVAILTEYKNPRDTKVPIYSELYDLIRTPRAALPVTTPAGTQVNNDLGGDSRERESDL